jgi:4-diphosphocytidyl-2-C-methyl-D-erythritol kinase
MKSFAKVNLSLDVTGKLENGYHTLRSVMQAVELFDEVFVESAEEFSLVMEPNIVPVIEDNLAYKAAVLMAKRFRTELRGVGSRGKNSPGTDLRCGDSPCTGMIPNIYIKINKRIPAAAGLAGSSTDAAAVMILLAELWNLNAGLAELCELGASLGADVPFCLIANARNNPCRYLSDELASSTALAEGIGDILTPLPPPDGALIIVKPRASLSTPRVYGVYDLAPEKAAHPDTDGFLHALLGGESPAAFGKFMVNALQYAALSESLETAKILGDLKKSLPQATVFLSGSGSAIVAYFPKTAGAKTALPDVKRKFETDGARVFFAELIK